MSGTQFFFGLKKNEKSASGRRKKNILKIKFSKKKLRKFFFSTSLTTFLRWTMAENARGAQYQPCRDVTFFDFHENRLRTHVEISRKNSITFFVFRFRRQKESYSTPLDLPVTQVCCMYAQSINTRVQSIVLTLFRLHGPYGPWGPIYSLQ